MLETARVWTNDNKNDKKVKREKCATYVCNKILFYYTFWALVMTYFETRENFHNFLEIPTLHSAHSIICYWLLNSGKGGRDLKIRYSTNICDKKILIKSMRQQIFIVIDT